MSKFSLVKYIGQTHVPANRFIERLREKGILIRTGDGPAKAIINPSQVSPRLENLLKKAGALTKGLVIEIGKGLKLSPSALADIISHGQRLTEKMGEELISVRVELDGLQAKVEPRTWREESLQRRQMEGFIAASRVVLETDELLLNAADKEAAEKITAGILFRNCRACELKVYQVSRGGLVRVSHSFVADGENLREVYRGQLKSHFQNGLLPGEYEGEATWEVVINEKPFILVSDPATSDYCRRLNRDGSSQVFETKPFIMIPEKIGENIVRLYKLDWENTTDMATYFNAAVLPAFRRLAETKNRLAQKEKDEALKLIGEIAIKETNIGKALGRIAEQIAVFFRQDNQNSSADSVTVMLNEQLTNSLFVGQSWTRSGMREINERVSAGDLGIARRIFNERETLYLNNLPEKKLPGVKWRRGGQGSLIGVVIFGEREGEKHPLGLITACSKNANAFTEEDIRFLEEVSASLGPSFQVINKHAEENGLDDAFGRLDNGKVYNRQTLDNRLKMDIKDYHKGRPVALIYFDIDHFKHLNESWNHKRVDLVLQKIFFRIRSILREGEIYRVGGEEVVVRVPVDLATATLIAERIRKIIAEPINVQISYPRESWRKAAQELKSLKEAINPLPGTEVKWPDHGLLHAGLNYGREGTQMLLVTIKKTASFGVTELRVDDTPTQAINRADGLSKKAKEEHLEEVDGTPIKKRGDRVVVDGTA